MPGGDDTTRAEQPHEQPSWLDDSLSGRQRVALWLLQRVGLGNNFTIAELRHDFPEVAQIDRRLRDLSEHGWRITNSQGDATLQPTQRRFVAAGDEFWRLSGPAGRNLPKRPSSARRQNVMSEANYACSLCGIPAGAQYLERPVKTATIGVQLVDVEGKDDQWIAVCDRCRSGRATATMTEDLNRKLDRCSPRERELLMSLCTEMRPKALLSIASLILRLPQGLQSQLIEGLRRDEDMP